MSAVHELARTTPRTRAEIKDSRASMLEMAERHNISKATAHKWSTHDRPEVLSHRPHKLSTALTPAQNAITHATSKVFKHICADQSEDSCLYVLKCPVQQRP